MSMKTGFPPENSKKLTTVKTGKPKHQLQKRYPKGKKGLRPKQGNKKCYLYQKH